MDNSKSKSENNSTSGENQVVSNRKVSEIKLSDPKSSEIGFMEDFKLFLSENSNLVIGVSIGTLILVFGVLFALTSNQSIENQNKLSEIASSATGALIVDQANDDPSESPPTLVAKTNTPNDTSQTGAEDQDDDSVSSSNPRVNLPLSIGNVQDSTPSSNTVNVNDISSGNLSNQPLTNQAPSNQSPFAGGSSFLGANTQGVNPGGLQNLSANVPSAQATNATSLGANPNVNRTGGFLSNTQSQVLQSRNVQGNTGPAVYYTLAFSFLASFLYRLRKKKTD